MITALTSKTFRDHWKSLTAWAGVIVFMTCVQLYVYPTIAKTEEGVNQLLESFPESLREVFRMQDYGSGAGFLSAELFSMMIPLVVIAVGATWGASGTAQEEEAGTADLLFSLPLSRQKVLVSKMIATVFACFTIAAIVFINIVIGAPMVDMVIDKSHLFAACCSMFLLGTFFSGFGFVVGALTGKKGVALGIAAGIGILTFLFYSLSPLVDTFDYLSPINPIQWSIGGNQLFDGADYVGQAKLAISSLVLYILTIISFNRKDIRS